MTMHIFTSWRKAGLLVLLTCSLIFTSGNSDQSLQQHLCRHPAFLHDALVQTSQLCSRSSRAVVASVSSWSLCTGNGTGLGQCKSHEICSYRPGRVYKSGLEREGVCEAESCNGVVCGFRQLCYNHEYYGPTCSCPKYQCQGKMNPVCGRNGKTYDSECHLREEECSTSRYIGVASMGKCKTSNSGQDEKTLCLYQNQRYHIGDRIPSSDPCKYIECQPREKVVQFILPGCEGGPIEQDIGVTKLPVDGEWGDWSKWSLDRLGPCESGLQYRQRFCDMPSPANEGKSCQGLSLRLRRFHKTEHCPPEQTKCEMSEVDKKIRFSHDGEKCVTTRKHLHKRCATQCSESTNDGDCCEPVTAPLYVEFKCSKGPKRRARIEFPIDCKHVNGTNR